MTSPFPVVDYTSRDYTSILSDMKGLIPTFFPTWTSRSSSDFGIVLLELFAYTADSLHYYADRIANEAYLGTATQRSSVLKIASMLDYTPTAAAAAVVSLAFTNNSTTDAMVPSGTQAVTLSGPVSGGAPVVFETSADLAVPAGTTKSVSASEGTTVTSEVVGSSTGLARQKFPMFNVPVISVSINVYVTEGVSTAWTFVSHLLDYRGSDKVFTTSIDDTGVQSISFGDGVNGKIPDNGSLIQSTYRVGGGLRGNVVANTITRVTTSLAAGVTVINSAPAIGGADAETTNSIRLNAPLSLQSLNRAVSLQDYSDLAVTFPGVAKAKAVSSTGTAVSLYTAPFGGGGVDTSGASTAAFATLQNSLLTFINVRKYITTTVTMLPPTYVPINISVTAHILSRYSQARVKLDCQTALTNLLSFDNVIFGDMITLSDLHATLLAVEGLSYIDVTLLDRGNGTGVTGVTLASKEIPTLGTVTLTMSGGIS